VGFLRRTAGLSASALVEQMTGASSGGGEGEKGWREISPAPTCSLKGRDSEGRETRELIDPPEGKADEMLEKTKKLSPVMSTIKERMQ
jgi:hypothetical protein